ncbi:HotDog domain-containing protein [Dipodascopsis uninucleata]
MNTIAERFVLRNLNNAAYSIIARRHLASKKHVRCIQQIHDPRETATQLRNQALSLQSGFNIGSTLVKYIVSPLVCFVIGYSGGLYFAKYEAANLTYEVDSAVSNMQLETEVSNLPIVKELRGNARFEESRPQLELPRDIQDRVILAGPLAGPGKLNIPPIFWLNRADKEIAVLVHIGNKLNGHTGIVHGGLLAILMDEVLTRCAFLGLPNKVGVTANLNIDYRQPVPNDGFLLIRAKLDNVDGRKAWVKGWAESVPTKGTPTRFVEGEVLVVEPKWAKLLPQVVKDIESVTE